MIKAAAVVSGDGAEIQNLLDGMFFGEINGFELSAVVATEEGSYALRRAANAHVDGYVVASRIFPNSGTFTRALTAKLLDLDVDAAILAGVEPEPDEDFYRVFAGRCICLRSAVRAGVLTGTVLLADADGSEARRFGRVKAEPQRYRSESRRALVAAGAGEMLTEAVKRYVREYHG